MLRFLPGKRKKDKTDTMDKKVKIVSWQPDWLRDENLKDWLQKHPIEAQTAIFYCKTDIKFIKKSDLTRHADSKKHKDNIDVMKKSGSFETIHVQGPSFRDRVHTVEMITSQFLVEQNVGIDRRRFSISN